jgi:hypothetical protein
LQSNHKLDKTCFSQITEKNVLKLFFALYELTVNEFDIFVPIEAISEKSSLSVNSVEDALDKLPVQFSPDGKNYRIDGPCKHFVPMLLMFAEK